MDAPQKVCPKCALPVLPEFYVCPNCGRVLRIKPLTVSGQIVLYLVSVFLPPFGLIPSIKYFLQSERTTKIAGLVGMLLTLLSFGITVYLTMQVLNQVNQQVAQFQTQGF